MASAAASTTTTTRPTGLRLGDPFPDFSAETSQGKMESFHKYIGNGWGIFFSHPDDFTPVCTTELLRATQLAPEFAKRDCKMAAISCNDVTSHKAWIDDICAYGNLQKGHGLPFPIIADPKRDLAYKLGMLDPVVKDAAGLPMTCRAVFIVGPEKTLKLSILYPASTGRNFDEILRVLDSLQMTSAYKCATPADWQAGKECMVLPSLTDDDAKKAFPAGFKKVQVPSNKGYLRFTPDPRDQKKVPHGVIFGIENPLLDMCAQVPETFLGKYELKLNNAILAEPKHLPIYEEIVKGYEVDYVAGGATQNSIRVAQWFLQSPGATKYVGSIGKGCEFGKKLREVANKDGVTTLYYESETSPTGTCAVLVNGGERSLVANLAAANDYKHAHTLTKEVSDAINNAKIFYTTGFFLTPAEGPQSIMHIAQHAAEHDKVFAMNIAAPFIVDFFYDKFKEVIPYTDFIFANESEAATFAKKHGWDEKDIKGAAEKLAKFDKINGKRKRTVVFTQGKDPTIVYHDGVVHEFPVPLLDKSKIVDTNGAGDAFVGGFLAQLAIGQPIAECVRAGQYTSREVIQRSGCTFPPLPAYF